MCEVWGEGFPFVIGGKAGINSPSLGDRAGITKQPAGLVFRIHAILNTPVQKWVARHKEAEGCLPGPSCLKEMTFRTLRNKEMSMRDVCEGQCRFKVCAWKAELL